MPQKKVEFTCNGDRVIVQFKFFKMCLGPGLGQVAKYAGFQETVSRVVFHYGDKFLDKAPHLLTILPNGVIETYKTLIPAEDGGLITFPYPQFFQNDDTRTKKVENSESSWNGTTYDETPFVDFHDEKCSLIQTWPVRVNEKFRKDFTISETNPDPLQFDEEAVDAFKVAIDKLFGKGASSKGRMLFCSKVTKNDNPCYVGTTEQLRDYMLKHTDAMKEVGIKEFLSETSFMSEGEDGKGKKIDKPFDMKAGATYVIYKKKGWETMGCCKPWEQFANEAEFLGKCIE